jgi:hypothetical protein
MRLAGRGPDFGAARPVFHVDDVKQS